jgi:hypothetical protein
MQILLQVRYQAALLKMYQDTDFAAVMCVMQDFREVQDAHEKFVKTLKQQSLVYSAKMMGHIHQLLSMARRLCALVRGARGAGIDMDSVQVPGRCVLYSAQQCHDDSFFAKQR